MREFWAKLLKRSLSAAIMMPLAFACLWAGGVWWLGLVIIGAIIAGAEAWVLCCRNAPKSDYILFGFFCAYVMLAAFGFYRLRLEDFALVFHLIVLVIVSDVAAYFGGKLIGGARLCPSISPNKTYAGLLSGWLTSWAIGFVFFDALWLGLWVSPLSQVGDLAISALKRRADVKDSGYLIPGHGGVLDRLDGHLAVMAVAVVLYYFLPIWVVSMGGVG